MANINGSEFDLSKYMSREEIDMVASNMWRIQNQLNTFPGMKNGPGMRNNNISQPSQNNYTPPTVSATPKVNTFSKSITESSDDKITILDDESKFIKECKKIQENMYRFKDWFVEIDFILEKLTLFANHYKLQNPIDFLENYNYFTSDDIYYCDNSDFTKEIRNTYNTYEFAYNNKTISYMEIRIEMLLGEYFVINCFNLMDKGVSWNIPDDYLNTKYNEVLKLSWFRKQADRENKIKHPEYSCNYVPDEESDNTGSNKSIVGNIQVTIVALLIFICLGLSTGFFDYFKIMIKTLITVLGF